MISGVNADYVTPLCQRSSPAVPYLPSPHSQATTMIYLLALYYTKSAQRVALTAGSSQPIITTSTPPGQTTLTTLKRDRFTCSSIRSYLPNEATAYESTERIVPTTATIFGRSSKLKRGHAAHHHRRQMSASY